MSMNIQELFHKIQDTRKQQKEIRSSFKEALQQTPGYEKIIDEYNALRARKKELEISVKEDFASEFTKLEDLKIDMESDIEMISDMALNHMVKGETVEISDEYDNKYEPRFKVNFKKVF